MPLTLRAIALNDRSLTEPITARFGSEGGSIGSALYNTLTLPDPELHISRKRAEIRASADGYLIPNVGSANPIIVRGQPLGRGESARLLHRDPVRIGGYLLEVIEDDAGAGSAVDAAPGRAGTDAPAPVGMRRQLSAPPQIGSFCPRTSPGGASAGLADLNAPLSACNPFADLLPPAAGVSGSSAAWGAAPEAPVRALLPDDFDPFAMPAPPPPTSGRPGYADRQSVIPFVPMPGQRERGMSSAASTEILGIIDGLIALAKPASADVMRALGITMTKKSGPADYEQYIGRLPEGTFDHVKMSHRFDLGIGLVTLKVREGVTVAERDVDMEVYGPNPVAVPYIHTPPEGSLTYTFFLHEKRTAISFQYTSRSRRLMLVTVGWNHPRNPEGQRSTHLGAVLAARMGDNVGNHSSGFWAGPAHGADGGTPDRPRHPPFAGARVGALSADRAAFAAARTRYWGRSAMVESPIQACRCSMGNWLVTMVARVPARFRDGG